MKTLAQHINIVETMPPYNLTELQALVIDWGKEKGIIFPQNVQKQNAYILCEYAEMKLAYLVKDYVELVTEIGDVFVTMIITAACKGETPFNKIAYDYEKENQSFEYYTYKFESSFGSAKLEYLAALIQHFAYDCGFTPEQCLFAAYQKIKNRTGKTVDGVFVKDKPNDILDGIN